MDYELFKKAVIAQCEAMGIEDYELYYETGANTSIGVFGHEINDFASSEAGGVCFRCIAGGKIGYASTQSFSEEQAKNLVIWAADSASVLESEEKVFLCDGGQTYEPLEDRAYPLPSTEELAACALDTQEKLYAANSAVVDGSQTQVLKETSEIAIYNSRGLDLHYENQVAGIVVSAVVSDGTEMADSYEIKLGELSKLDTAAITAKAAGDAVQKLGGNVAPTGQYPVIFNPDAMSSLLGTFSSIFSSENTQKGLSRLGNLEGQMVAAPCVTLIDDPFHKENPSPRNFDGEGCPTHCKNVIENGRLNTLLYNLKTAAVAGKKTTGNACKGDYASSVSISPFTMYLANGSCTEEQLLEKAGNGVYINSLDGLHAGANPVSGDFSLQSAGFMIENGKKTDYVKSFTVAGNFYQVLKDIRALADNCKLPYAMGSTAFGSPSVLVDGLSIAGK